jgi:copper chaperone CopZ
MGHVEVTARSAHRDAAHGDISPDNSTTLRATRSGEPSCRSIPRSCNLIDSQSPIRSFHRKLVQAARRYPEKQGFSRMLRAVFCLYVLFICLKAPLVLGADPMGTASEREALVIVKGVATPFSVFGLIRRFNQIPGVESATFDLSQGLADVKFKPGAAVSDEDIRRAVRDASYTPGPIRRKPTAPDEHAN